MRVLVFDNYDSFTYNLVELVRQLGFTNVEVHRNDKMNLDEVGKFDKIILSPGPGIPSEAGLMPELVARYAPQKSILGVCLGHQCIGEVFGGTLENMKNVVHGKAVETKVTDASEVLFKSVPPTFLAGRYHSWVVSPNKFPDALKVTALDSDGRVMALAHKQYDVRGVQFHPESVLTEHGSVMLKNWLAS